MSSLNNILERMMFPDMPTEPNHNYKAKEYIMNQTEILEILEDAFSAWEMDPNAKNALIKTISLRTEEYVTLAGLRAKLAVLFEYEKNYLELIKTYKEEIKFAGSLQEDLRKERAKFFSETLKEVSGTLEAAQVESSVASMWLKELVNSYTKSLDLSSGLVEEHTLDMIGKIRKEAKSEIKQVDAKNLSDSKKTD